MHNTRVEFPRLITVDFTQDLVVVEHNLVLTQAIFFSYKDSQFPSVPITVSELWE